MSPTIRIVSTIVVLCVAMFSQLSNGDDGATNERLRSLIQKQPVVRSIKVDGEDRGTLRQFKDTDIASGTFGTELCLLEVKSQATFLKVKDLRIDKSVNELYENSFPLGTVGIMTGGFFGVDEKGRPIPLGFEKENYRVVNPSQKWTTGGVVFSKDKVVRIESIAKFRDNKNVAYAVQSKPLLIEDGRDGILQANFDRFDRSAIARTVNGETIMAVIYEPGGKGASLAEFSRLLLDIRSSTGGMIQDALAMDGGPGAHLYVPALRTHCGAGIPNYVPNALYLQ